MMQAPKVTRSIRYNDPITVASLSLEILDCLILSCSYSTVIYEADMKEKDRRIAEELKYRLSGVVQLIDFRVFG